MKLNKLTLAFINIIITVVVVAVAFVVAMSLKRAK